MDEAEDELQPRVEALFAAALELDAAAREALLAGEAPRVRAEVASLLAWHEQPSTVLDGPPLVRALDPRDDALPERIGPYRIEELLGQGGMGVVYRARQDDPRRTVALKVLRPLAGSPELAARFRREARLLARLQHPGIAQVYATGEAPGDDGPRPWIAMELVEGAPLDEFADAEGLDARARIELVAQVCAALAHAHERGIVHRDLKPSNVLVERVDGRPRPRLLDFGIARADGAEDDSGTLRTTAGSLLGTLAYMAPEQAAGAPVDARTDVYALGAVAYQLLAGRLPLDVVGRPLHEALRIVQEEEPAPLSRRAPALRGDVEAILAKALEKRPARRYPSAAELGADLRRHLEDRPVLARPPSRVYRAAKLARRHRAWVVAAAGVLVALLLGLAGTTWQALRAARAAERSERALARSQAVAAFQRDVLQRVAPRRGGRDLRLVDVLDATAASLPGGLVDEPDVEAALRASLGEAYRELGLFAPAEEQLARACALFDASLGRAHVETLAARAELAGVLADRSRPREALALLDPVLAALGRSRDADDPTLLAARLRRAGVLNALERHQEAEQEARAVLAARRVLWGDRDARTNAARASLGAALWYQGRLDEAEGVQREAYESARATLPAGHPELPFFASRLANVVRHRGDAREAAELYRGALELGRAAFGHEHPDVLTWMNNLAGALQDLGELDEAEELLSEVVDRRAATLGAEHAQTLLAMNNLALLLSARGRVRESLELQQEVLATKRRTLGDDDESTLTSLHNLGLAHLLAGEVESALAAFEEAAQRATRVLPAGHWRIARIQEGRGACLQALGRLDEAEPVLREALERARATFPDDDPRVRSIADRLLALYAAQGRAAEARSLESQLAPPAGDSP